MEEILRTARMDSAAFAPSTLEPIPDDLLPDAAWVRAQGWTPLEFLVYCYRNPWVKMGDRIRAAQATLDYAHRKFSTTVQVTGANGSPLYVKTSGISLTPESLAKLTDDELDAFRVVLEKLGAPAVGSDAP